MGLSNMAKKLIKNLPTAGAGSGEGRAQLSGVMTTMPIKSTPTPNKVNPMPYAGARMNLGHGIMRALKNRVAGIICIFCFCGIAKAEVPDLIQKTLLEHVSTVTQFKSGETKLALVDSVILIGNYKGRSIFDLQAGYSAETNPDSGEANAGNFIIGGLFKVSSLLKDKIKFPAQWVFLNSIEYGLKYDYDTREKRDYVSLQVGLDFSLNPRP